MDTINDIDGLQLTVDGKPLTPLTGMAWAGAPPSICGAGDADWGPIKVVISFAHSASNITLNFRNIDDEGPANENTGIRDLSLIFKYKTNLDKAGAWSLQGLKPPVQTVFINCNLNQYKNSTTGFCNNCDISCYMCSNGTNADC